MKGLVRLPIDVDPQDRQRYIRALDVWSKYDWDTAIKVCVQNNDWDALCQFPFMQMLMDVFYDKRIPIFKVEQA